ncbi:MAG: 4-alpha-glucanotransferase [Burkholderiales bacterium PBB5]|nr:MAG: 4-alpha-glucanotransferase [Burkholderiales bacterium PBB5]
MNLQHRAAGVLLHVTSLPGPHGIGDFGPAAYRFADWLASCGQTLWQWLPTTPIGPGDSPYQSVSAFAGSPLMVALEPLVAQGWLAPPVLPDGGFDEAAVDYARVVSWRMRQLRLAFAGFQASAGPADRHALAEWALAQAAWADDYSLFMALETAHQGQPWWRWPAALRDRDAAALEAARQAQADEIGFWQFVQWCFDTQCAALRAHCHAQGVHLMGDLPIFVAHHSADVWARPDLYALDDDGQPTVVAGCPPDDLGPLGQRWGNPLYRWDRMAAEGFAWWTARVRRALSQADVFRIDHFRGFAAYFEIPASSPDATVGTWRPGPGQALFDAIGAALGPLPIVAEDLGFITPDVHALRQGCGFPGMKILQFAFGGGSDGDYLPHNFARDAVVYTGTHDNNTSLGWWQAAQDRERHYAGVYLACGAHDVHWAMVRAALNSVAQLAMVPLQDVLGLDARHRMNTPGTQGGSNWCWRFTWSMLGSDSGRVLGLLTAASGRGNFRLLGLGEPPPPAGPAQY